MSEWNLPTFGAFMFCIPLNFVAHSPEEFAVCIANQLTNFAGDVVRGFLKDRMALSLQLAEARLDLEFDVIIRRVSLGLGNDVKPKCVVLDLVQRGVWVISGFTDAWLAVAEELHHILGGLPVVVTGLQIGSSNISWGLENGWSSFELDQKVESFFYAPRLLEMHDLYE